MQPEHCSNKATPGVENWRAPRIESVTNAKQRQEGSGLTFLTFENPRDSICPAMPRKPRIEIGGWLYHVITRGNNRQKIFRSHDDYLQILRR